MHRLRCLALLVFVIGCQVTAERVNVMPLPAEGDALSYADVVQRARFQAAAANDAFYVDKWAELQEAAGALEKTSRYLVKSTAIPDGLKAKLPAHADELIALSGQLREAARAQDVKKTNDVLQKINLKIRELKPEDR